MNKLFTYFTLCLLLVAACAESPKQTNNNHSDETDEHAHLVNNTNKAWANAEELNKRVSPPKSVMVETNNGLKVAIHYSSPYVKNRAIWDSLVPYNEVWRTGANEATILELSDDVSINGNNINAGSYSLFTIPTKNSFTVILNSVFDQWGAYEYDENKDVIRFDVEATETEFSENLDFFTTKQNDLVKISFVWERRGFELEVKRQE